MTLRATVLGLALGLLISAFTLFNDGVIRGPLFIANHFPVSVFGVIVVLLLAINPLLRHIGPNAPLGLGELAIIAAIGLAACGWPSAGLYWGFIPNVATAPHWAESEPAWQAQHVMSYVPGASDELGYGHVRDWSGLARRLVDASAEPAASVEPGAPSIASQVWQALHPQERQLVQAAVEQGQVDDRGERMLLMALNRIIREVPLVPPPDSAAEGGGAELPDSAAALLEQRPDAPLTARARAHVNRWLLVTSLPRHILPPPDGQGVLVAGEEAQRIRTMVIQGSDERDGSIFGRIPWGTWWPTLRLWGGFSLTLGLAALCLTLIVHPQWARRELLPYPIAQFMTEIGRTEPGAALPQIATNRLFWIGFITVAVIHGINALGTWIPALAVIKIPLTLNLYGLGALFPGALKIPGFSNLLWPHLYLSAIAFAFFLNTRVSFSVGIAYFAYVMFAVALLSQGVAVEQAYLSAGHDNLMRFGAYIAMTVMIIYIGRRYYGQLARAVVGLGVTAETPRFAVWAGRGLVMAFALAVVSLRGAGIDWVLAVLFVLLVLIMFLVLTRIVCETGLFFVQSWWMPMAVLTAVFGTEAIGPTSYIVLAIASILIVGDPRTTIMPYLATGLQIVDRSQPRGISLRIGGLMLVMIVVGFFVAGAVTFAVVHDRGIAALDNWAGQVLPSLPFGELAKSLANMRIEQTLTAATAHDGLTSFDQIELDPKAWAWIGAGAGLLTICSIARLRLPWWPIHPVLFLIWGTMPASRLGVSFLLGWMIKLAVVKTSGTRGYRTVLPLMVGVLAGELIVALLLVTVGAVYYLRTGMPPASYGIYP